MLQVRGEPDATGPDAWRGGTQRKLFELMARFALRSVQRLQRHFVVNIERDLAARAMLTGGTGWTCHGPEGPHFYSQLLECFGHLRVGGKEIPSARWQLMWAFAEMNLAAWELFQARRLYWYEYDTADTTKLDNVGGCSSHSAGVSEYMSGPFGEDTGTPCVDELVGKAPGSDAHLEYLLRCSNCIPAEANSLMRMFSSSTTTTTTSKQHSPMFGTELDVLAPFSKVWPALRVLVDKIDAVTVPTSFKVAIDDLFSEFWASQVGSEDDDEESSFSGSESEDGNGEEDSGEEDSDEEMQDEPAGEERAL
jgi:hypothetical protein